MQEAQDKDVTDDSRRSTSLNDAILRALQPLRAPFAGAARRLGPRWTNGLLLLFWGAPLWTGVLGRLVKRTALFQDYQEVACAAQRRLQHLTLYGDTKCAGLHAAPYVYPPWVADAFAAPLSVLGLGGLTVVYVIAFVAATAALLWFALWRPLKGRDFPFRVAFLGFIAGGPVAFGNISVLVHASVYAAALFAGADSLLFALTVTIVSLIKPLYLLLFALTAFSPAGLRRKALIIGAGAVLPLAAMLVTSPDIALWRETVVKMMSGPDRGGGFTNMMDILGVASLYAQAPLYALYAGTLLVSGLVLAEFGQLSRDQRVWLGGAIGVLMFPRIMCYDVLVLGPGVIAALAARAEGAPQDAGRFGWLALASCFICYFSTIFGGLVHAWRELSYLGLVAVLAVAAFDVARQRFPRLAQPAGRGA